MRQLEAVAAGVVSRNHERLPLRREEWPDEARRAWKELLRELNAWSRERSMPGPCDPELAEDAVRAVWEPAAWHAVVSQPAVQPEPERLASQLRSWPPEWRYRVAELERSGMGRRQAVSMVRQEHRHVALEAARLCA